MTAEVRSRSTQCTTNDTRIGMTDVQNAGELHNPTIASQAKELTEKSGKQSFRTITSTFWCDSEEERIQEFNRVISVWPTCKYVLYGPIERTEENKKPHCHCIIAFASSKQWKTIIKTLPCERYHHEKCRNFSAAREYCWKTNPKDILEFGTPLKQGARTDLKKLMEDGNYDPRKIREIDPALYSRYRNGINDVCADHQHDEEILEWLNVEEDEEGQIKEKEYKPAEVYWFFGPTGTGKSRTVKEMVKEELMKKSVKKENISIINKMENGFAIGTIANKTDILILDEFRGSSMRFSDLLALIDGSSINVKGGKKWVKAKKIFITSCFSPMDCYPKQDYNDSIQQLIRRIKVIKKLRSEEEEAMSLSE